jgi:hypothetical protein
MFALLIWGNRSRKRGYSGSQPYGQHIEIKNILYEMYFKTVLLSQSRIILVEPESQRDVVNAAPASTLMFNTGGLSKM